MEWFGEVMVLEGSRIVENLTICPEKFVKKEVAGEM
jgi:hypothetical protein